MPRPSSGSPSVPSRAQRARRGWAVLVVMAGLVGPAPAVAHVLPMAVAAHRAHLVLDDLQDDPLRPVTFAHRSCARHTAHSVRCELFLTYDDGDTCARDYHVAFVSSRGDRLRTRLGPCA